MAIAGPNYECLHADAGTNGRVNNGGVWYKCGFSKALENQDRYRFLDAYPGEFRESLLS